MPKPKKIQTLPVPDDRRAFSDPFGLWNDDFLRPLAFPAHAMASTLGEPVIDVFEHGNTVVVTAELPGTKREDISIKVDESGMELRVRKKEAREEKREDRRSGSFSYASASRFEGYERIIPFKSKVSAKSAKATYKNGVLEVRIPKRGQGREGHEVKVE